MESIDSFDFEALRAVVRVDFNVPLDKVTREVTDDTRVRGALPTIRKIIGDGGSVILLSHLGRPDGRQERYSMEPVVTVLEKHLDVKVKFSGDCMGKETEDMVSELKMGEVLLLENVRFYPEEQGKVKFSEEAGEEEKAKAANDMKRRQNIFAEKLAGYADVFVNDAFGTAHRAHATTALIAGCFPPERRMFGFLINSELKASDKVLVRSEKPFTAVMGGAKVSDKIDLIKNLFKKLDNLIIGGGMAYTFLKALGGDIGDSMCETDKLDLALSLVETAEENGVRLLLPVDSVNGDRFEKDANVEITDADKIRDNWLGLDIGNKSIELFRDVLMESKTILWNGPMGVCEIESFAKGTTEIARIIAEASDRGAFTLVGGGDSVAAINRNGLTDSIDHISTGGGALLEYIEGKKLPGITAIRGY